MSRFLKLISNILILGYVACGCNGQSQQAPTNIPTVDLTPLTSMVLSSDEINTSNLLNVDEGLEISDRSDCLPKDCVFSVWDILQQETLMISGSNASLQLTIGLRSFQNPEDANSHAVKMIGENGGQPGIRMIEIPIGTLPEQSWAYAEDGRVVYVITVSGNIEIGVSLSHGTGGINEPEAAVVLVANVARMQMDKLMRSNKR